MLSLLHIENIAVIENADIALEDGLTVLTGETGAGKSIVIDSIGAILGGRVSRDLIRSGAQKGFVSAVFTQLSPALRERLEELELTQDEEDDTLHVQRQIAADGKSICRINMRPVAASVLKGISPLLINVHGQHDGQKLMDEKYHIDYLDAFAGTAALLEEYMPNYQQLLALRRRITELETNEQERLQRIDMLAFHKEEIEQAALQPGEDVALLQRKSFFDNTGKVLDALERAHHALGGEDETLGACALLTEAADALCDIKDFDEIGEKAREVQYLAQDIGDSVAALRSRTDFSPEERAAVEERLDLIYRLKQKYGGTLEEIQTYLQRITEELDGLQNADTERDALRERYRSLLKDTKEIAAHITDKRRSAAKALEERIVSELCDLDMSRVQMHVAVETGTKLTAHGMDQVAFQISVNPGEALKPLSKVASGGELSRIMLAMKNVLTEGEDVGMLIFDEIDTGVSGHAAQRIARKLSAIARKKQTLCVTHLPQIAAMGDHHLLITKSVRDGRSYTDVLPMDERARAEEIARMISGDETTKKTISSAQELLDAAVQIKKSDQ